MGFRDQDLGFRLVRVKCVGCLGIRALSERGLLFLKGLRKGDIRFRIRLKLLRNYRGYAGYAGLLQLPQ